MNKVTKSSTSDTCTSNASARGTGTSTVRDTGIDGGYPSQTATNPATGCGEGLRGGHWRSYWTVNGRNTTEQ